MFSKALHWEFSLHVLGGISVEQRLILIECRCAQVGGEPSLRSELDALLAAKEYKLIGKAIRRISPDGAVQEDLDVLENSQNVVHIMELLKNPPVQRDTKAAAPSDVAAMAASMGFDLTRGASSDNDEE